MKTLGIVVVVCALFGCGPSQKPGPKPGGGGGGDTAGGGGGAPDPGGGDPGGGGKPAPPAAKSLYERLGGQPAITAVVDEFVTRTTSDPRIKERFFNTDADNLKRLLVEFVCNATGGPCQYSGRDMATSHAGMDLVDEEFTALVENLIGALDKFKVGEREKGELLGALGPLQPQIVAPADKLKPIDGKKLEAVTKLAAGVENADAKALLTLAVIAGHRGQRQYAEQLFARAELVLGTKALKKVAGTFRAGAPPRIDSKLVAVPTDSAPQPTTVGGSEADDPDKEPAKGSLTGTLMIGGKPPQGLGVVMLWPDKGKGKKRTPKQRVIEQRGKAFAPHVMAVPVGSTVAFPNFDTIFHNVFSLSKSKAFDLGLYKNGDSREMKFDKPGVVRLGCSLHANMSAYLVIVDAPHYVVTKDDGSFEFKSLKPGKYKAKGWSEASDEPVETKIEIKEGKNSADIGLAAATAPAISPDKFGTPRTP